MLHLILLMCCSGEGHMACGTLCMCFLAGCLPPSLHHAQVQRPDDSEDTVRTRLVQYNMHVEAVKGASADMLVAVDGDRPEAAVWADVETALLATQRAKRVAASQ